MPDPARGAVRIGTSGWHYKHWVGNFYPPQTPASKMLGLYQQQFDTVELNNSFYQLPKAPALEAWRTSTPENFCFAVKASRFLTHMKKLRDAQAGWARFEEAAEVLREKLGPILFQLPPNWEVDVDRLQSFVAILPRYHRYAFEFRNQSWDIPQVYQLLKRSNIAYCIFDLAGYQSPTAVTTDFAYVRLHGPGGKYQGSYSAAALATWAAQIWQWRRDLASVYVYFDNDDSGFAAANALTLKQIIEHPS